MRSPAGNKFVLTIGMILIFLAVLPGCTTIKKWTGLQTADDEEVAQEAKEAATTPEAVGDTVVIGGKTYVRGRNPYYLTYPAEPEYVYYEKGKEFTGLGDVIAKWRDRRSGKEKGLAGVPPEKVQEMVRAEVERILREQGRGGDIFVSKVKATSPYSGRAVAVVPALRETPKGYDGLNLTLANNLRADLARQRDLVVMPEAATKEAEAKLIGSKITTSRNIQALGHALGVQGVIITQVIPPGYKDSSGYVALSLYETFNGSEVKTILEPFAASEAKTEVANKVVSRSSILLGNEIRGLEWFGRIEFMEKEKIFVNVGNNAGLKPGKLLQVVQPGKEVRNPQTNALLGYTNDVAKGELRVTEVLGKNAVAAVAVSGGPFQPNDLVKPR